MPLFYLSFADDDGWLGCVHIYADTFIAAVDKTHRLGINPGGEVAGLELEETVLTAPELHGRSIPIDKFLDRAAYERLVGGDELVRIPGTG